MFLTLECGSASEEKPAVFVLGNSTADVRTNSFLPSSNARANFPHNGIDFPHSRATGRNLMALGARKFGIISVPPIGCCPSQRVLSGTGECLEVLNELALAFHSELGAVLKKLSSEYESMKYSLGNAYDMTMDVIVNPLPHFKDVKSACCGSGTLNAEGICDPKARLCLKRHKYLFWDLYHSTHAASKLAAVTLYTGGPRFVTPMNFSQTIKLVSSAALINGKQKYGVNSVSFVPADTPLKVAEYFNIGGIFRVGSILDSPTAGKMCLNTSMMGTDYRAFIEVVIENHEDIVQSWHLNGYAFWIVA
ncbi:hypothetical protein NL676_015318 [Syzygium grande]|nr:hypothetical protein NL676_015318 [Syzygium grande]